MATFLIFCNFMLSLCCASVIRNGMKLTALPIPGICKNGSIIVNTRSEQNDVGDQVQEVHTVTVKTPVATLTFSNASQYEKSIVEQARSSLEGISDLSHLDPSELIDLDVPVRVNDLLEVAQISPATFREKIYGSKLMEKLIDTLQQKSVELLTLKNELDGSHKILKRESTFADNVPIPYLYQVRWSTPDIQNGQWPLVSIISPEYGRSSQEKAALPIHHLHLPHLHPHHLQLPHRTHLPYHRPVPHRPLHLLQLLRTEALPILRFPLALLNFVLAGPLQHASTQSMLNPPPQTIDSGLERPHKPQLQHHSLTYGQEPTAQPPETVPEVNPPLYLEYYGGIAEQADADQISARIFENTIV